MNLILFFFFSSSFSGLKSQNKPVEKSEFDVYSYKPEPRDRVIFEINHTGWLNTPRGVQGKLTSGGVNFYLYFDYPIASSRFSFAWGAGISSHNVHGKFNLKYQIDSIRSQVMFSQLVPREDPYSKNRFGLKVLEVPIEFRFRTRTSYQFKVMAGMKAGWVVQSFRKVFDADGKRKMYDLYGVNPLRYGAHVRVGVEQLQFTFFMALSSLFENGKGSPDIKPYSVGISWTPRISLGSGSVSQQF